MGALQKIELEVTAETANALTDERRRKAVGHLVDEMVRTSINDLLRVCEEISARAEREGFTDEDLQAELAAYNAEHRT